VGHLQEKRACGITKSMREERMDEFMMLGQSSLLLYMIEAC
jgi:hypothetical protein